MADHHCGVAVIGAATAGLAAEPFRAKRFNRASAPLSRSHAVPGEPAPERRLTAGASYANQSRAKVETRAREPVRLHAFSDGRLTGAERFAPAADHMAHLLAFAIGPTETASSVLDLPFYHSTRKDGLTSALGEICETLRTPVAGSNVARPGSYPADPQDDEEP